MARNFRAMLWEAVRERQKLVALEAFPKRRQSTAIAEVAKILGPSATRGNAVFDLLEATLKYGDRDVIRRWFERRLMHTDPAEQLADLRDELHDTMEQLELFGPRLAEIVETLKEHSDVIPLESARRAGRRGRG